MTHLILALKEVEAMEGSEGKAGVELNKAVEHAVKMRNKWRTSWGLIN